MSKNMFLNLTDAWDFEHQTKILSEIKIERARQNEKWGVQTHSIAEWMMILGEEFGEACNEGNEAYFRDAPLDELRKELIHTMAVAFAIVEGIDNQKGR